MPEGSYGLGDAMGDARGDASAGGVTFLNFSVNPIGSHNGVLSSNGGMRDRGDHSLHSGNGGNGDSGDTLHQLHHTHFIGSGYLPIDVREAR
jgi:hypothetical protein